MASKDELMIRITAKDATATGINSAERKLNSLSGMAARATRMMVGLFAVDRLKDYTLEMAKLGGEVTGVQTAFTKMGGTPEYLDQLKEATRGTVSELDLMKRAVQANNFDIPLSSLASLFEFATKRSQETGESVDYLVNSIIMGIGRKSPLILDNLGISAVQLRQRLKGVGTEAATVADIAAVVGDIASEAMEKSGAILDENNLKVQSIVAQWKDFKAQIATNKAVIDSFGDSLTKTQQMMAVWNSEYATTLEKWAISVELFDKRAERLYNQVMKRGELAKLGDNPTVEQWTDDLEGLSTALDGIIPKWEAVVTVRDRINTLSDDLKKQQAIINDPNVSYAAAQQAFKDAQQLKKELIELRQILSYSTDRAAVPEKMQSIETDSVGSGFDPTLAMDNGDMEKATAQAKEKLNIMYAEIQAEVNRLNEDLSMSIANGFSGGLEAVFSGAGIEGVLNGFLSPIASFLQREGVLLIAHGLAVEAFKKSLESLTGVPAIIAGGAMIATAAAFKSFVGGGVSGGGGGGSYGSAYGGGSGYTNYQPRNNANNIKITLAGKMVADGNDMVWNARKNEYIIERTLG